MLLEDPTARAHPGTPGADLVYGVGFIGHVVTIIVHPCGFWYLMYTIVCYTVYDGILWYKYVT